MAPKIFSKIFKRKKEQPPGIPPKEWAPNAIGISDSTCEINGDVSNRWKLPIPAPKYRTGEIGARPRNPQNQSIFFRLPVEIRRMVYVELMGNRRVHIRHVWKDPSPFRPRPKHKGLQWDWWHCVCADSDTFPEDRRFDYCRTWVDEAAEKKKAPKINGVEWLRSCQIGYEEALEVLYGTNVFAMNDALDTPFTISRKFSSRCVSLLTSIDISIPVGLWNTEMPENDLAGTYCAMFDLFDRTFRGLRSLRLELRMPAYDPFVEDFGEAKMKSILEPMDRLSKTRSWTRLQLCVPALWYIHFKNSKETMGRQAEWELTETDWAMFFFTPCVGMT
ncbi:uncharacterized protein N7511_005158 [Penicillium nucicola]|uniref:uncharacterized protein n=1 Tax=Penicillium nucicola TaxID=1850975 RepID=UPI0025459612|nr:uncharacterized protein N7511_005158 [Penicillium nucicola]KAJ5761776.1 hypothetical protein N7511_005158 [Penicillium nucicola]